MSTTVAPPTFASCRNAVTDLMESGEPFRGVEDAIDETDLGEDMKAALWLFAFFAGDSHEQQGTPPHLTSVG